MNFYTVRWKGSLPNDALFPCVMLMEDSWNDYGFVTYFTAFFYDEHRNATELGGIKILDKHSFHTKLSDYFQSLENTFCSLGQSYDYYELLRRIGQQYKNEILSALNDVIANEEIAQEFINEKGFSTSLLRFSEASKIFESRLESFSVENLSFNFRYQLDDVANKHEIFLDFSHSELPYRINAFVGKNATGKTKIMTALAACLSGIKPNEDNFDYEGLPFSKIIAISYSAFDELYKPFEEFPNRDVAKKDESHLFSYVYCGLRNSNGLPSKGEIAQRFFSSYKDVQNKNRVDEWENIIKNVFDFDDDNATKMLNRLGAIDINEKDADSLLSSFLSSGQQILLSTITAVIANIETQSLLLFDEPEIHLHPNAIASFMRMFYKILDTFNSYSIIATHSPLIIQEIPSRYVNVFNRIGNAAMIEKPDIECFGESISNITNDIFEIREYESNYKTCFKKMAENRTKEDLIDLFDTHNSLSFNALTYLNSLYKNKEGRE